jgi:hypothetical protein
MSTRSLVVFENKGKEICTVYRQSDGYPDGMGKDLYELLKGKNIVSGYTDPQNQINGFENLIPITIWGLVSGTCESMERCRKWDEEYNKKYPNETQREIASGPVWPCGGVYVYPVGTRDCGEEFIYTLSIKMDKSKKGVVGGVCGRIMMKCQSIRWSKNKKTGVEKTTYRKIYAGELDKFGEFLTKTKIDKQVLATE